jgi:hypothetical protein
MVNPDTRALHQKQHVLIVMAAALVRQKLSASVLHHLLFKINIFPIQLIRFRLQLMQQALVSLGLDAKY